MTPLDAPSSFYYVLVSLSDQQKISDDEAREGGDDVCIFLPSLPFLRIGCIGCHGWGATLTLACRNFVRCTSVLLWLPKCCSLLVWTAVRLLFYTFGPCSCSVAFSLSRPDSTNSISFSLLQPSASSVPISLLWPWRNFKLHLFSLLLTSHFYHSFKKCLLIG